MLGGGSIAEEMPVVVVIVKLEAVDSKRISYSLRR